jgi:cytoplasmic FMR1 interacting protein
MPDRNATEKIEEINSTIVELLRTEIKKMVNLMLYITSAIEIIYEAVARIAAALCNESHASFAGKYSAIIRLLDELFKLDNMKDMKGSMKSDFSRYKRAIGTHSSRSNESVLEEMMELQLFLSSQDPHKSKNYVLLTIRDRLKNIKGFERVLNEILDLVVSNLDNNVYVTPDDKFGLIRLVPHLMVLVDGDASDTKSFNVFKKSNAHALQRILKKYPVVPLFGDMTITVLYILERAQHFNKGALGDSWALDTSAFNGSKYAEADMNPDYDIRVHWASIRTDYSSFAVLFTNFVNQLSRSNHDPTKEQLSSNSPLGRAVLESSKIACDLTLKGISLLSQWKGQVLMMMAWKYSHPSVLNAKSNSSGTVSSTYSNGAGKDLQGIEYEQVIQNNFTDEELSALVDVVSLIKSLSSMLDNAHTRLAPMYRAHQHHRIQQVTRNDMLPLMHRVDKRKKAGLLAPLLQIVNFVADYGSSVDKEVDEDYKVYSRKQGQVNAAHQVRAVSAGTARLHLLRSKLHGVFDERSVYRLKAGLLGKADLEKEDITLLEAFYCESFFFPCLLDFSNTLREVSSLGDLRHQEFHLELTKCVQFPIEMSLPWLLIERAIAPHAMPSEFGNAHIPMVENVLFMLDIYNDVAYDALHVLCQQHLFDEVEAETNLVLEQTIMAITESTYEYFKDLSASSMLEAGFKKKIEDIRGTRFLTLGRQHLDCVMSQRHVSLLGRNLNFSAPFIQVVVRRVYMDIDTAIGKFEDSDVCHAVELTVLLDIIRHTHKGLATTFELQAYPLIFQEANEALIHSPDGRIIKHLLFSIDTDVIPNYSYNCNTNRFVRSPEQSTSPALQDKIPRARAAPVKAGAVHNAYGSMCCKAFEAHGKATRGFFGRVHVEAVLALAGCAVNRPGVFLIFETCLNALTSKLQDAHDYIAVLRDSIPDCKLPPFTQHVGRCVEYFDDSLRHLLDFDDLKSELFQLLREIGNTVLLLKDLSDSVCVSFPLAAQSTAHGIKSYPLDHLLDSKAYPTLSNAASLLPHSGDKSLFQHVLKHIETVILENKLFQGWTEIPSDGVRVSPTNAPSTGFHITWSAITFLSCLPTSDTTPDAARFGDGFTVAGCLILHLLRQREIFELTDFCRHILHVHAHDCRAAAFDEVLADNNDGSCPPSVPTAHTESVIAAAVECCSVQEGIFSMLEATWRISECLIDMPDENDGRRIFLIRAPRHKK